MLSRDAIGRHRTSDMFFSGDRLPGFSDTSAHPDGLGLVDLVDDVLSADEVKQLKPGPMPYHLVC